MAWSIWNKWDEDWNEWSEAPGRTPVEEIDLHPEDITTPPEET